MNKEELDELYKKYKESMEAKIARLRETSERALRLCNPFRGAANVDWSLVSLALNSHNEMMAAAEALQVQTRIYKDKILEFEK